MGFCVFCGSPLSDPARCGACGAYKVGSAWHEGSVTNYDSASTDTGGWRPDPTGRHEGRYYVGGRPTDLIRDGTTEDLDPVGKQQLDQAAAGGYAPSHDLASPGRGRRRFWWISAAVIVVLALVGAGVGGALYLNRDRETVDEKYLAALQQADLSREFNSDANAIASGKQVCRQLEEGAAQQGMPADQVAVQYYCPQFSEGFEVLETSTVTGSFVLKDESSNIYSSAITVTGSTCSGSGGYSDIEEGTPVTVKNGKGEILATAFLEAGEGGRYQCTFPFSFEITEGEERYVVAVGRRGELSYTFDELKANGVMLVLG